MHLLDSPFALFVLSFLILLGAAQVGDQFRRRLLPLKDEERGDFGIVLGATLTMLGLLIGFTFSMAVSRYDTRKNYEEAEANAIGTEYARADLLPTSDASRLRDLLRKYTNQRVLFYTTLDPQKIAKINADTTELQTQLWSSVRPAAAAPTPLLALAVSGMNDVLNSQGYTQAAWWNRIPGAAWLLMLAIAICCNFLLGYGAHQRTFIIVPLAVSISFFLIADIDSPRGGEILVVPQNLIALSQSFGGQ